MTELKNYVNGELAAPESGAYLDNFEPATGQVYAKIPNSGPSDVAKAAQAAQAAFPAWANTPADARARVMERIAELIERDLEKLALAESRDNGKPLKLARRVDIPRASANFRFYARAAATIESEAHPMENRAINYTLRQPLGVVGCISPWNLPLYLFTWKIAPALASGNCVVAKPSEVTPVTAYLLSELCIEAGLPPGALNIVHGLGPSAGQAIVDEPLVKAISFTGGTSTGEAIARAAAPKFKKLSLELGGKNPNIIFADCDYDRMLKTTVHSSFANQGQICLCGSRIFIEESLYPRFRDDFIERVRGLRVKDPLEEDANLGAVVSADHQQKILSYIQLAKEEGGTILCGGEAVKPEGRCADGWFVQPTVIEGLSFDCRTNQEEIFGPVVTLTPFRDEEHVLAMANSTSYGLSATIWTENLTRAHRVAARVDSGIIWINCWLVRDLRTPFGGMKNSGMGREGGFEALRFFTEPKNVCVWLGD